MTQSNVPVGTIRRNGQDFASERSFLSAQDAVRYLIRFIGDDPAREDLLETPDRVVQAYREIFAGYHEEPRLKWFRSAATEMIVIRDIDFWSTCEHHMLPFFGAADVGYFPDGWVLGMSKIPRLVDLLARRLTIQEALAEDIKAALTCDRTKGVAVHLRAKHACVMCRGAKQSHSRLETTALGGRFLTDQAARMEFMQGIRRNGI